MGRNNIYMPQDGEERAADDGVPNRKSSALESYRYLEGRRQTINDSMRQRPPLRLWTKDMKYIGQIAQAAKSVPGRGTDGRRWRREISLCGGDNWLSDTILYGPSQCRGSSSRWTPTDEDLVEDAGRQGDAVNAKRGS